MTQTTATTIIGAGIIGSSVAYHLAKRGAKVLLLDSSEPASGTTSTSFAWVNANNKTPREYFDLNFASMEEHHRLSDELAGDWLHETGNIIVGEDLTSRVERLRAWDYAAENISPEEASKLEPNVSFPDSPAAYFPRETWADAPRLARTLVEIAQENGAKARFGESVESVETSGGKLRLRLEGGEEVETGSVVNAAGPRGDSVAAMFERTLPLDVFRGLLVRVGAPENPVNGLVHTPSVNVRPDGNGYVLLHHDSVDEKLTDEFAGVEDPLCEELLERGKRLVSSLEDSEIFEARFGLRPVPGDGYSCVGGVSNIPGYYEAVTHSGVTLGPLIGRLLAGEVLDGEVDPLFAPFRPDRF